MTEIKNENKNNPNFINDKSLQNRSGDINLIGKIGNYVKSGSYKIQEKVFFFMN